MKALLLEESPAFLEAPEGADLDLLSFGLAVMIKKSWPFLPM